MIALKKYLEVEKADMKIDAKLLFHRENHQPIHALSMSDCDTDPLTWAMKQGFATTYNSLGYYSGYWMRYCPAVPLHPRPPPVITIQTRPPSAPSTAPTIVLKRILRLCN